MKLLYTKRSPYARKVRVIALEKNISLDLVDEDLQKKSQRLLDANPLGKIPTLVLDNGTTIFDSPVICQYLDNLHEEAMMIPREAHQRIGVLKWEAFADDLTAVAINLYMEKVRHPNDFHKDFSATSEANILLAYTYIEKNLSKFKEFNLAPIAVVSAIGYIHFRLPHLKVQGALFQWFGEISKRPSMSQTMPVAT
jgi:glutathione S-transferase